MSAPDVAPLDLRELFAQAWEGDGELWRPWWLRALPLPTAFRFRSESLNRTPDAWDVLDTMTFPDGRTQQRRMHCERLATGVLRLAAKDMPGGATVHPRSDGFDFAPYVIRQPTLGRLRLPLRHHDTVSLQPDGTMLDTIELRLLGVRVGIVTLHLHRTTAQPAEH